LVEADLLSQEANRLYSQGRYAEAIPKAREALQIRERVLGPEHPSSIIRDVIRDVASEDSSQSAVACGGVWGRIRGMAKRSGGADGTPNVGE
jgi:hypothetical protein